MARTKRLKENERRVNNVMALHSWNALQQNITFESRPKNELELIGRFVEWFMKHPAYDKRFEYQPKLIDWMLSRVVFQGYLDSGCGSGKTYVFGLVELLRSYLDDKPCVLVAPMLALIKQSARKYIQNYVKTLNEFLSEEGLEPIKLQIFSISSDSSYIPPDDDDENEEYRLNVQANEDLINGNGDIKAERITTVDGVVELLQDRTGRGDVILVCNDSLEKFVSGLKQSKVKGLTIVIDEFQRLQSEVTIRAELIENWLNEMRIGNTVIAASGTPKSSLNDDNVRLAINSGVWGVNIVWHSGVVFDGKRKFSISPIHLRALDILKKFVHVWVSKDLHSDSIESELIAHLKSKFKIKDAKKAMIEISKIIATVKLMEPRHVGLAFLTSVSFIKAFMSADNKKYREELGELLNVTFYESHADVPTEMREKISVNIDAALDAGSTRKHMILNHSTWIMGMDYPKISWVLIGRNMTADNLVQAISRGTRASFEIDICNIVISSGSDDRYIKSIVEQLFGALGTDNAIQFTMVPREGRTGQWKPPGAKIEPEHPTFDIRLDAGHAVYEDDGFLKLVDVARSEKALKDMVDALHTGQFPPIG